MKEIRTEQDFVGAQRPGAVIAIKDSSSGKTVHVVPCDYVRLDYFRAKVIVGKNKNGRYYLCDSVEEAQNTLGARSCACAVRNLAGARAVGGT